VKDKPAEAEETPPLSAEQFRATPEFRRFKGIMKRLLAVPKAELDRKVKHAKKKSPRVNNPNAPGRKPRGS
jgi:hypothetical protein